MVTDDEQGSSRERTACGFFNQPSFERSRGGKGLNTKKKKQKEKKRKDKKRLGLFLQLVASPIVFAVKQDETGQQQLHICFLSHFDGVCRAASLSTSGGLTSDSGRPAIYCQRYFVSFTNEKQSIPHQRMQSNRRFPIFLSSNQSFILSQSRLTMQQECEKKGETHGVPACGMC